MIKICNRCPKTLDVTTMKEVDTVNTSVLMYVRASDPGMKKIKGQITRHQKGVVGMSDDPLVPIGRRRSN